MSLQQEAETQTGERDHEFWNEQDRLTDSAKKHGYKACVAGMVTGLAMAVTPGAAVIGLEIVHQIGAGAVDLRKHELNKRKHEEIETDLDKSLLP